MKKIGLMAVMMLVFLCGCSAANQEQNEVTGTPEPTGVSTPTPEPTETPVPEKEAGFDLSTLETVDITELDFFVDKETSLKNSNRMNWGYLTYDAEGNIYYVDQNQGGIYVSGPKGENKRLLSENSGTWLQLAGDWLYYAEEGIRRINIVTGEAETIYELPCGEFLVYGEKVYIAAEEGICVIDPDNGSKEVICAPESIGVTSFSEGENFWFGNVISKGVTPEDIKLFFEGYIVMYDGENVARIKQQGIYPLLAGKYFSAFVAGSRHVWNLETGEDMDLKVYAQRVVSDGQCLYYAEKYGDEKSIIYRWDGSMAEEFLSVEDKTLQYLFLTPEALYCLPRVKVDGTYVYQLWYYDLETGETGQVY